MERQRCSRRPVTISEDLVAKARRLFPPGVSASGRPSYEVFRDGPLKAAEAQFGRQFDDLPSATGDVDALRFVMTVATPLFSPMIFYGVLETTGNVAIIDFIDDPDYWDLVGDDPGG
ncbi:MAG: hypothetical protein U5R31_00500 [Acidimicrobiia bacterium]|nr:hypothetical protein [Acidimicrobiia bacterium]